MLKSSQRFIRLLQKSSDVQLAAQQRHLVVPRVNASQSKSVKQARKELKTLVGSAESFSAARDESVTGIKLASSQADLPKRSMKDSYCEASIPLGSDKKLREKYVNFHNTVRFGRVLEDLDTMAVWISYTHNRDPSKPKDQKSPLSIVTAAVDRIDMRSDNLLPDHDVHVRGHVSYVGSSSMEVTMSVEQDHGAGIEEFMEAKFVMVARDPLNVSKAYVNPLEISTDAERKLFNEGEVSANKITRQKEAKESLFSSPPNEKERLLIHDLFLRTLDQKAATFKNPVKPEGAIWMEHGLLKNIIICFPEKRNLYNKIFGGFLMRQAFELAWASACVYSKKRPFAIAIDDIMFRRPVPIGSLLFLSSQVVYTDGPYIQVKVHLEVVDPLTGKHETTNTMHVTFNTKEDVPQVMPRSYAEYMMFVDGKRHFEESIRHLSKDT